MWILVATFCAGLNCVSPEWAVDPKTAIPHNCLAAVNELAPKWLERHPGYVLQRARCVSAERLGRAV